jgi:hypothetical protein
MSRSLPAAACLTAAAVLLGGCGESDHFVTDRPILRLRLDDYRILPQNVRARPGRIKIVVRNEGRLTHNLAIQRPPATVKDKYEDIPGARVQSMQPGQAATPIKVDLAPGTYRMVCTIANHDDLGQYGELVIEGRPL